METLKVGSVSVAVTPKDKHQLETFLEDAAAALVQQPALLTRIDELMRYERATETAALALVDVAFKLMMQMHDPNVAVARIVTHLAPGWRPPVDVDVSVDQAVIGDADTDAETSIEGATTVSPETVTTTLAEMEAA